MVNFIVVWLVSKRCNYMVSYLGHLAATLSFCISAITMLTTEEEGLKPAHKLTDERV